MCYTDVEKRSGQEAFRRAPTHLRSVRTCRTQTGPPRHKMPTPARISAHLDALRAGYNP